MKQNTGWLTKEKRLSDELPGSYNHKSNERWNEKLVRFGWIDFIDDLNVSRKLIETVENWGKKKG